MVARLFAVLDVLVDETASRRLKRQDVGLR